MCKLYSKNKWKPCKGFKQKIGPDSHSLKLAFGYFMKVEKEQEK